MKKSVLILTLFVLSIGLFATSNHAEAQEPFLGEIRMFAGNFAPRGWAFCDGQLLPISQNQALFSLLGTIYGGDGRTTFALPDLRGRVPLHPGSGPGLSTYQVGQRGGEEQVTLNTDQIPTHNHDLMASNQPASAQWPAGKVLGRTQIYGPSGPNLKMMDTDAISEEGGGHAHENRQPYLGIHFIIALQGVYPSRD